MALGMLSTTWNISTTVGWIAMKCGTAIHVSIRMNCNNSGDPFTIHHATIRSKFHFVQTLWFITKYPQNQWCSYWSQTYLVLISKHAFQPPFLWTTSQSETWIRAGVNSECLVVSKTLHLCCYIYPKSTQNLNLISKKHILAFTCHWPCL